MNKFNFFILFITYLILNDVKCELSEKEMEDLETDMVVLMKKVSHYFIQFE